MKCSIQAALQQATESLSSESAYIDSRLLLQFVLKRSNVYLLTHPDQILSAQESADFMTLIHKRKAGQPVAYLRGFQEFWSLNFQITPHVLIPRPETEFCVEAALTRIHNTHAHIIDIGTGSGCIAIALAHERPSWTIIGTDIEKEALKIAALNAKQHCTDHIQWIQQDGLNGFQSHCFDAIISNPPYIAIDDPALEPAVARYEPQNALIAPEQGFAILFRLAKDALSYLKPNGYLILEHGYGQEQILKPYLIKLGYQAIQSIPDLQGIPRVLVAQVNSISQCERDG